MRPRAPEPGNFDQSDARGYIPTVTLKRGDLRFIDQLETPVWVYDLDAEQIWVINQAALALFAAEDLETLRSRQARTPMSQGMRRRLATYRTHFGRGEVVREQWSFYPEGSRPILADCCCSAISIEDDAGERLAMLVEARTVNREAASDEDRLVEALRHCNDCISLYGLDGSTLLRNPAAEEALGPSGYEASSFAQSFIDHTAARKARAVVERGDVYRDEVLVRTRSGEAWHDMEVRRVVDPVTGEDALLAVHHDVTMHHAAAERLREAHRTAECAREEAEVANRAKSAFLATMSHELRTPMTGVLTAAEVLRTSPLDEDQLESVEMVLEAGRQMVALVNDVLDLSRIEAGRIELAPAPVKVQALMRGALLPLMGAVQARGLTLDSSIADVVPEWLAVDGQRVTQVLTNLVSNAIKHGGRGTIAVSFSVSRSNLLRCEVSDEGPGIAPEHLETIFLPFERGSGARRDSAGLGLHIAHNIVTLMGGEITVQSTLGSGSTFSFAIPFEASTGTDTPAKRPTPRQLDLEVLVADDNQLNRRALVRLLKGWGCRILEAANGQQVLDLTQSHTPHLVLMDIDMPEMDGLTACRHLRGDPRTTSIPVVALTADAFFVEGRDGADAFESVLTKPVDWDQLYATLEQHAANG